MSTNQAPGVTLQVEGKRLIACFEFNTPEEAERDFALLRDDLVERVREHAEDLVEQRIEEEEQELGPELSTTEATTASSPSTP